MLNFLIQFSSAVLKLNRLLGTRFVPDHPSNASPLGKSLYNIFSHHNTGNYLHRDSELQRVRFLIQNLQELEKFRPDLLRVYAKNLRKAGGSDSFYGARFEIDIMASLLKKGISLNKGERPDLRINESQVSIECTSVRSRTAKANKDLTYKINASVFKKSKLGYANRSMALFIDITNISHLTSSFNPDEFRKAAINCQDESPFGALVLLVSLMNHDLDRFQTNYLRIDNPKISTDLLTFLNKYYSLGKHSVTDFDIPFEG